MELATRNTDPLEVVGQIVQLKEFAQTLIDSKFLPQAYQKPEQVVVAILMGRELGIPPMTAINNISIIQNKPSISPQLMMAMGYQKKVLEYCVPTESTTKTCTVVAKRVGAPEVKRTFTWDMAEKMGLTTKDNWKKQPDVMLQWRCVAATLRVVIPDVITGLYTPDEMGAVVEADADGNMTIVQAELIDGDIGPVSQVQPQQQEAKTDPSPLATRGEVVRIQRAFQDLGVGKPEMRDLRLMVLANICGTEVESSKDLSSEQAQKVIACLNDFDQLCKNHALASTDVLNLWATGEVLGSFTEPVTIVEAYLQSQHDLAEAAIKKTNGAKP